MKIFAEFWEASFQSQASNSRNRSTCHILRSWFSKITKQEFIYLHWIHCQTEVQKLSENLIPEGWRHRIIFINLPLRQTMRTRTEWEEESSQIPVTVWAAEASDLPEGQEGKDSVCVGKHCQSGLTSVCPLQMKKPSKQQDFSREINLHSPATAEGALNFTGQCRPTLVMCLCSLFHINPSHPSWLCQACPWGYPYRLAIPDLPLLHRPPTPRLCLSASLPAWQQGPGLGAGMVKSLMSTCLPNAAFTQNTVTWMSQMLNIRLPTKSVLFLLVTKQQLLGALWVGYLWLRKSEAPYKTIRMKIWV